MQNVKFKMKNYNSKLKIEYSDEDRFLGMSEKSTFLLIFMILTITLIFLPFLTTFNNFLTKVVENNQLYGTIQKYIVPFEAKFIGAILIPLGYDFVFNPPDGMTINGKYMGFTWNCIGWQSFLLLLITFIFGFARTYTWGSRIECMAIGILGTFFVNIARISFTALLAVHTPAVFAVVFHDYFSAFVTILWLCFFWWFSYKFLLVHRNVL